MHKKLFIPGPVEVRPDVLEQMAKPMIGHRSKEASELQRRISNNLKKLFSCKTKTHSVPADFTMHFPSMCAHHWFQAVQQ